MPGYEAFLGALWVQYVQTMPKKAVDLGYLNESSLHEEYEYEYVIIILIQGCTNISVFGTGRVNLKTIRKSKVRCTAKVDCYLPKPHKTYS